MQNPDPQALKKGSYILILFLESDRIIQVGKLGKFHFRKGYYVYMGSAFGPGGLQARLNRHLHPTKKDRWHIDYLRFHAEITEIWVTYNKNRFEHKWAEAISRMKDVRCPVPGFGSSDCRCIAHMFYLKEKSALDDLRKLIQNDGAESAELTKTTPS